MTDNNISPCKDCKDRYTACHGHCTKYADWKAACLKVKALEREYKKQWREDYCRSELCEERKRNYVKSKVRR